MVHHWRQFKRDNLDEAQQGEEFKGRKARSENRECSHVERGE